MDAAHEQPSKRVGELERIVFPLEAGAWHGFATETMWAETVSPGRYRLRNTPFYAQAVSFEDVVEARFSGAELQFEHAVERSGHSTYRLFVEAGITSPLFRLHWAPLETLGCSFEQGGNLLAVDVPREADIHVVYELLEAGARANAWDFEEGHCGHPL